MKKYLLFVLIIVSLFLIPLVSAENETDGIVPILIPAPIIPPTDNPTVIITLDPAPLPTIETTIPTTKPTTIKPTVKPTIIPTQVIDDPLPKFIGVLFMAIAICVLGAIITYFILTRKMKREDEEDIIL